MALSFNGTDISRDKGSISFNGTELEIVSVNKTPVWEKHVFQGVWSGNSLVGVSGLSVSGGQMRIQGYDLDSDSTVYGAWGGAISSADSLYPTYSDSMVKTYVLGNMSSNNVGFGYNWTGLNPQHILYSTNSDNFPPSQGPILYDGETGTWSGSSLSPGGVGLQTSGSTIRFIGYGSYGGWININ